MLTGRFEAIPGEGENITPTTWQSSSASFRAAYLTPFLLTPFMGTADRQSLRQSIDVMQSVANSGEQSLGQKTANWFSGFAGGVLNPYSLATGEAAGAIASGAMSGAAGLIGKYIPVQGALLASAVASKRLGSMALAKNAPNFIAKSTIGGLSTGAISALSIGTGFSLPERLAETYDPKTDAFNWWGGVKTSFSDGGVALGLMAVPYLGGILWGRMRRRIGEELSHAEAPMPHEGKPVESEEKSNHPALAQIDEAEKTGKFDKSTAQWYQDYITGRISNNELNQQAISLLIRDGHPVDAATKRVMYQIFKPEEVSNLEKALLDELGNQTPSNIKPLLRQFMMNNKIDQLRGNTKMLDGLQGVVEFINRRLSFLPEEMVNFNTIIKRFLPENIRDKNPLTQSKVYQAIKSGKEFGSSVPEQVEKLLRHDNQIRELRNKINNYEKELKATGKNKYKNLRQKSIDKLIKLEKSKPLLLKHGEELSHIRNKLMPEGKVVDNFKAKREYERLLDLTKVKNSAKQLMHELHVKNEYQQHADYAAVLDGITKVMRSTVGKLANPENVISYMKERVVREIPDIERIENLETRESNINQSIRENVDQDLADKSTKNKTFTEDVIKSFDEEMKEAPNEIRKEFDSFRNQFKEFNEQQGVFKNLIKCIQGTLNG